MTASDRASFRINRAPGSGPPDVSVTVPESLPAAGAAIVEAI
jgi:hypothetical protein